MSHFSVAVFTNGKKTVEELLAPFHEFECTGIDDQYVVDVDVTEELHEQIKDGATLEDALSWYGHEDRVIESENDIDKEEIHKYGYAIVQNNQLVKAIRRTNPNKKWDWYQEGGRWSNSLITKDGIRCDSAKVSDIDFEALKEKAKLNRFAAWNGYQKEIKGKQPSDFIKIRLYGIPKEIETLEQFTSLPVFSLTTYAAITPDGIWHAPGEMGWWGISSDSSDQSADFKALYYEKLITPAMENEWDISIIDCHI